MLDRLPYEPLNLIIRETLLFPPSPTSSTASVAGGSRATLWSAVGQAVLPEVFAPEKVGDEQVVLDGRVDGTAVRVLRLADDFYTSVRREDVGGQAVYGKEERRKPGLKCFSSLSFRSKEGCCRLRRSEGGE